MKDAQISTLYDSFEQAVRKFGGRQCLGWRPMSGGQAGDFQWHTYKEAQGASGWSNMAARCSGRCVQLCADSACARSSGDSGSQRDGCTWPQSRRCGVSESSQARVDSSLLTRGLSAGKAGVYSINCPQFMLAIQACNRSGVAMGELTVLVEVQA